MSDFMQRQVTGNENWLQVETTQGTEFVPSGQLGLFVRNSECPSQPLEADEYAFYEKQIRPYVEGTIQSWENIKGYGARLSAPGYLDCTEWTVFDTEEEAKAYLDENYPEEEEEDNTPQMSCDQCQMLSINGIPCHETGCPNMNSRWDEESGEWIKHRKCFECGCTVDADDPCCNEPFEEEEN